jgi:hypothetical protein
MPRLLIYLAIAGIAAVVVGIHRAPDRSAAVLDLPRIVTSGDLPLRSPDARQEGRLYWSTVGSKHFTWLETAAISSRGKPEILTGDFVRPVSGRAAALALLGADESYKLLDETSDAVSCPGGPFEEFLLYRTAPYTDEYAGFYAATHLGVVNRDYPY